MERIKVKYYPKRFIDVFVAFWGIILLLPLFIFLGLLVRVDSKGPIFYGARRIGLRGREFRMWKFRTMIQNADKMGSGLTAHGDTRITPVGKFLRRASLDELPQLLNVIIGDMSLVGPRPEIPEIVKTYASDQQIIFSVRPGITGLSQINGRDDLPQNPKLNYERFYAENVSLWLDIKILLLTIPAILRGEGVRY